MVLPAWEYCGGRRPGTRRHSALAQVNKHEQRAELLLSGLPARTSQDYADLRRLAGSDVRVQVLDATSSETWSFPRSRLKRLTERLQKLGVTHTTLDIDWNRLLKPPGKGLQMTSGQEWSSRLLRAPMRRLLSV